MFPKRHWGLMIGYVLMLVVGGFIPVILFYQFNQDPFTATIYTNIICFTIFLIILFIVLRNDLQVEKEAYPIAGSHIILWTIFGTFLALFAQSIAALIEIFLFGIVPESENTALIIKLAEMNPFFILIPALIGPIIEELVFRKILFTGFYKKMNFFFAAFISSLIFAVFHNDFTHLLVYLVMGFVFAFLYKQTKRIIVPILAHMAMNAFVVYTQLFGDIENPVPNEAGVIYTVLQHIGG